MLIVLIIILLFGALFLQVSIRSQKNQEIKFLHKRIVSRKDETEIMKKLTP